MRTNTWYISDLHFGHRRILEFQKNRKFSSVEEMDMKIIENWNKVVQPQDTVIVVGDVFLGYAREEKRSIMSSLQGKKILVKGNHDESNSKMINLGFDWSCDEMVRYIQGERVRISHFPYLAKDIDSYDDFRYKDRRPIDNGEFLIHGHTHSSEKVIGKMIHVGCDAWNLTPVSENKIASIINKIKTGEQW